MFRAAAKHKIAEELAKGAAARQNGFEGRARVCARRAAGEAIREYLALRSQPAPNASAYDLLALLQDLPEMPDPIRQAASRMLVKVDETFQLPADMDLLAEAAWLAQALEEKLEAS